MRGRIRMMGQQNPDADLMPYSKDEIEDLEERCKIPRVCNYA